METMNRIWLMLGMIPRAPKKIDGATLEEKLANQGHTVTRRTIQRDLDHLSTVFPLVCDDRSKPYGWSWKKDAGGFSIPGMEPASALTLILADAHLKKLLPPAVWSNMLVHLDEAKKVLGRSNDNPLRSWPEMIRVIPANQPLKTPGFDPEVLDVVCEALLREKRFSLGYRRRGEDEIRSYEVTPLGLVNKEHLFYLVATLNDHDNPVLLLLHRMQKALLLDERAAHPANFSLDAYIESGELNFAESPEELRLEMWITYEAGCHLLETPLSDDQRWEIEDDCILIKATVRDTRELRSWLLGFGDELEVIKPKRLRVEMKNIFSELNKLYK